MKPITTVTAASSNSFCVHCCKANVLERIESPADLRKLNFSECEVLAKEIRDFLIDSVSVTGGHLGPNLGVVELTMAIHRVFDSPRDSIVFDTGHQTYVHKILTGRKDFSHLREGRGLAGYPQRTESVHDIVESSHASSSLSWADGISKAFEMTGQSDRNVITVVGDGALTGGMTWEALNNISHDNSRRLIIVVNDNGRSYAPTIGGMARYLSTVRTRPSYRALHRISWGIAKRLGGPARAFYRGVRGGVHGFLSRFINNESIYANLDIKYVGPIDGHNLRDLERALEQAKDYGSPVLVHAITQKGKGFEPAIRDEADQFHAIGAFDPLTGEESSGSQNSWTSVFGDEMLRLAKKNKKLVGITAAMLRPTGLAPMAEAFPERVFDVGIAEQHATTSAAGLAFGGLHPVVAIYSTFMGRAIDQLMMDVALHRAGVTFVLDRAGVTGPDGASHHGMWDLALLQIIPGIKIAAPRDGETLREELDEAVKVQDGPTAIRFPKGSVPQPIPAIERTGDGVDVIYQSGENDVLLVAIGSMSLVALEVAEILGKNNIGCTVIDPRWVVPIAGSVIKFANRHRIVVSLEDGIRVGGVGTRIRQALRDAAVDTPVDELGLPDEFLEHDSREEILKRVGLTAKQVAKKISLQLQGDSIPAARKPFKKS